MRLLGGHPGLLSATVVVAIGLGACSSDDDPGSATTAEGQGATTPKADRPGRSVDATLPNALGAPGTGRNGVGDFGARPTPAERVAIVAAVNEYNAALAAGGERRACPVPEGSPQPDDASDRCAVPNPVTISGRYTADMRRKLALAKVTGVRVKGNNAVAAYTAPGPRWNLVPLKRRDGAWSVGKWGKWSTTE